MIEGVTRRLLPALLAGIVATVLLGACGGDASPEVAEVADDRAIDYDYLIPAGSAEAMAQGEEVEIIPAELTVTVGEVLRIVNEDDIGHTVGPFFVGPGETLLQEFTSPGTREGICTVHPSGSIVLTVVEA
jgi:plastocyanin